MTPSRVLLFLFLTACAPCLLPAPLVLAWPVPDTGQTKCYDNAGNEINPCPSEGEAFYGQDGCYSINPMSYTKLDENGDDLPEDAAAWVMVRDNVTGLIWESKQNKNNVKNYSDPHDADNTYTWYDPNPATNWGNAGTPGEGTDTEDFIKALNDAYYGGHNDWRMPTIKELNSIVDHGVNPQGSHNNILYFPNSVWFYYWSSNTEQWIPGNAWVNSFGSGGTTYTKIRAIVIGSVPFGVNSLGHWIIWLLTAMEPSPIMIPVLCGNRLQLLEIIPGKVRLITARI